MHKMTWYSNNTPRINSMGPIAISWVIAGMIIAGLYYTAAGVIVPTWLFIFIIKVVGPI